MWASQFPNDRNEQQLLPIKNCRNKKKQTRGPDQDPHQLHKKIYKHQYHPRKLTLKRQKSVLSSSGGTGAQRDRWLKVPNVVNDGQEELQ
ncbi:hypothetical protein DPMN_187671 [Dreissena polymorpha]|uniref:Uncharacterized protein n=1 Tax=Dreissena polymorpha TaxID=45954 RepID=A0A9D4I7R8_DREPO|nr:hypothetical protein DPMN_187671 [Dreissena polymorpha]